MEPISIFFQFLRQHSTGNENSSFFSWKYFSVSPSFRQVETSFLSTGNSIVLFQVFLLVEAIIET